VCVRACGQHILARNGSGDGINTPPMSKMTAFVCLVAKCLSAADIAARRSGQR